MVKETMVEETSYNPVQYQDRIRSLVALTLVVTLTVLIAAIIIAVFMGRLETDFDKIKDLLGLLLGPIFGFLGYYSKSTK